MFRMYLSLPVKETLVKIWRYIDIRQIFMFAEKFFFHEERHKPLTQRDRFTGPECSYSHVIVTNDLWSKQIHVMGHVLKKW